jgi:formate-dependent nitrite reductase membrane component NrfD
VYQVHNHVHDSAQLLVRRLERDLRWAKDRRRQHERELADARRILATKPIALAGRAPQLAGISLLAIVGGFWAARSAGVPAGWMVIVLWLAVGLATAVCVGALVALLRVRSRRAAARRVLDSHSARLSHTQYHLNNTVHAYIDAHVEARNARELHLV